MLCYSVDLKFEVVKRIVIAFSLVAAGSISAIAQENCSAHWRYNTISYENDIKKKLAIIHSITRSNFEQRKREFGSGLTMPVEGVPLSGYANYDELEAARQRMSAYLSYDLNLQQSESYLQQFVSPESLAAVKACLANQFGLHAILDRVQGNTILLSMHWKPTVGNDEPIEPLLETVIGGELHGTFPTRLGTHHWTAVTYSRSAETDFVFRAQGGGHVTQPVIVPAEPRIDAKPYSWKFCSSNAPLCFEPDKNWNPDIVCAGGATVVGVGQTGKSYNYKFSGPANFLVLRRHAIIDGNHYSRIKGPAGKLPGGYRLHTIVITCNP